MALTGVNQMSVGLVVFDQKAWNIHLISHQVVIIAKPNLSLLFNILTKVFYFYVEIATNTFSV